MISFAAIYPKRALIPHHSRFVIYARILTFAATTVKKAAEALCSKDLAAF
jgi:hypothetical protein